MSLFETSPDPGITPASTQKNDRWHAQQRPDSAAIGQTTQKNTIGKIPYANLKDAQLSINNGTYRNMVVGRQDDSSYGLTFNDGANNILLIGQDSTGKEVVKIAKPGFDAKTASDANLIFNSNSDIFKIISKIVTTIPAFTTPSSGGNSSMVTVPHGLPFTPIANVYASAEFLNISTGMFQATSYAPLPLNNAMYVFPTVSGALAICNVAYAIDATNIYIQASSTNANLTILAIPVTAFLLQETATP